MATTTNYGWVTPDDTSLVKDGAAAIRTLGSSVDTTTKALNPSTTLGDIEYRSSTANTNTRLGIGSSGQVLSVSGGVPAWSTLSSGGLTLIATASPSSASTVSFTSIPTTYKHLMIVTSNIQQSDSSRYWSMRFNNDSGGNYNIKGVAFTNTTVNSVYDAGVTSIGSSYSNAPIPSSRDISSPLLGQHSNSTINIYNYASTTLTRTYDYFSWGYNGGAAQNVNAVIGGAYASTGTAITQIDFIRSSTQTISGTIQLYGVS